MNIRDILNKLDTITEAAPIRPTQRPGEGNVDYGRRLADFAKQNAAYEKSRHKTTKGPSTTGQFVDPEAELMKQTSTLSPSEFKQRQLAYLDSTLIKQATDQATADLENLAHANQENITAELANYPNPTDAQYKQVAQNILDQNPEIMQQVTDQVSQSPEVQAMLARIEKMDADVQNTLPGYSTTVPGAPGEEEFQANINSRLVAKLAELAKKLGKDTTGQAAAPTANVATPGVPQIKGIVQRGALVKKVQQALSGLGFNIGRYGVDSKYGQDTETALHAYELVSGLKIERPSGQLNSDVPGMIQQFYISSSPLTKAINTVNTIATKYKITENVSNNPYITESTLLKHCIKNLHVLNEATQMKIMSMLVETDGTNQPSPPNADLASAVSTISAANQPTGISNQERASLTDAMRQLSMFTSNPSILRVLPRQLQSAITKASSKLKKLLAIS